MGRGARAVAVAAALAVGGLALGAAEPAGTQVDTGIASAANGAEQLRLARAAMGPDLDRLMAHLPEAMPDGAVPLHAMWAESDEEASTYRGITLYYGRDGDRPNVRIFLVNATGSPKNVADLMKGDADFWREREREDPSLRGGGPRLWFVEIGGRTWLASSPGRNTLRVWGYQTVLDDGVVISISDGSGGEIARRVAEAVRG
jgi:hypothetical protein